jgi:hypothetical protein
VTLTFDLLPWKSIGFQILLRTKYVPSLVKMHWSMLILGCSQGCYGRTDGWTDGRTNGRTDGSVIIPLRNFVGEGIINMSVRFLIFLKGNETKLCDFESRAWRHVLDAALCDQVYKCRWFSLSTLVHPFIKLTTTNATEIVLKMADSHNLNHNQ